MNIDEFQSRLKAVQDKAREQDNYLKAEQLREAFSEKELDQKQLLGVLHYLTAQGIRIEGLDESNTAQKTGKQVSGSDQTQKQASEEDKTVQEADKKKQIPLTPEEKAYLKTYLEGLPEALDTEDGNTLLKRLAGGDSTALKVLSEGYLRRVADLAVQMHTEEILLADLIQEANLSLLDALTEAAVQEHDEAWLLDRVQKGIARVLEEQSEQKMADDSLVARVERLDKAVRELSDDEEDGKSPFSVNELAIILDMDVDEIRDTLRLTGDDK